MGKNNQIEKFTERNGPRRRRDLGRLRTSRQSGRGSDQQWIAHLRNLVTMANENVVEDTESLRHIAERADVLYGVWADVRAPHGVGHLIIKGEGLLSQIAFTKASQSIELLAVRCASAEWAEAARRVVGDAKEVH